MNVVDGEAERRQSWILDLKTIVKQGNANGRAPLRIVCMEDRIHDRFPDSNYRVAPDVGPLYGSNDGRAGDVFLEEDDHLFSRAGKVRFPKKWKRSTSSKASGSSNLAVLFRSQLRCGSLCSR